MSDQTNYDIALQRLAAAIEYLNLEEIREFTNQVEHQVAWRMAEHKARMLTTQPHRRLEDTDTVNYYNLLEFTQAIDADVQVASRAWTWVVIGEGYTDPHIIEELRQRQVEVEYIRGRVREVRFSKVEPIIYLLGLWVAYL